MDKHLSGLTIDLNDLMATAKPPTYGTVQSVTSTIVSDVQPPENLCTFPSSDRRNKIREAARRWRINRKDSEYKIESERRQLENKYRILSEELKSLLKQVGKWRNATIELAQI